MFASKCEMFDTRIVALNCSVLNAYQITNKTPYLCHGILPLFEFL